MARELDVRAAALDADGADDVDRGVAELLVCLVRQRHLRRDRDRIARVNAHRVEVLDRADDHDIVAAVADHLELELVPAEERLLDEHLANRALLQGAVEEIGELRPVARRSATVAAEREGGTQDHREGELDRHIFQRSDDRRLRHLQPG